MEIFQRRVILRDKSRNAGVGPACKSCGSFCARKRRECDKNHRLIVNTRNKSYKALKGMTKQSTSRDILGRDIDKYRKWIEYQFSPEMNWSKTEIDHVKHIASFDICNYEGLRETFNWKKTQPIIKTSSSAEKY